MTSRNRVAEVLAGLFFLVSSACSAQPLTVAEYAVAMESVTHDYISESQALSLTFHETVESEVSLIVESGDGDSRERATQVTVREMVLYFALLEEAIGRYVERSGAIEAPPEVRDQHAAYVGAVASVHQAMPATRVAVDAAGDLDAISAAVASSGFQDGQLRWTAACLSLESAVRGEGIGVDLGCTRPPPTQ